MPVRSLWAVAFVSIFVFVASPAMAQYGGQGLGSALSNNAMVHQGQSRAGIDDAASRAAKETPFRIIKDVKLGLKDVDPNARVQELEKLRPLDDPEVNPILEESMSDRDVRVKIKAIDILGVREANSSVGPMSQMLFVRSTEPIVKLHLIAALGRIGDANGVMPIIQFMGLDQDEKARGTAVFALGEIGSEKAGPLLQTVVSQDRSDMVRRLAKEALQKVSGELATEHARNVASAQIKDESQMPTDQKLAKVRAMTKQLEDLER